MISSVHDSFHVAFAVDSEFEKKMVPSRVNILVVIFDIQMSQILISFGGTSAEQHIQIWDAYNVNCWHQAEKCAVSEDNLAILADISS